MAFSTPFLLYELKRVKHHGLIYLFFAILAITLSNSRMPFLIVVLSYFFTMLSVEILSNYKKFFSFSKQAIFVTRFATKIKKYRDYRMYANKIRSVLDMDPYNLKTAKKLFKDLLKILNKFDDYSIYLQKGMIMNMIYIINSDMNEEQKFSEVKSMYEHLSPLVAKGALSELYILRDDFKGRKVVNETLDRIHRLLWQIFQT